MVVVGEDVDDGQNRKEEEAASSFGMRRLRCGRGWVIQYNRSGEK